MLRGSERDLNWLEPSARDRFLADGQHPPARVCYGGSLASERRLSRPDREGMWWAPTLRSGRL
jgi:hypothetical protein